MQRAAILGGVAAAAAAAVAAAAGSTPHGGGRPADAASPARPKASASAAPARPAGMARGWRALPAPPLAPREQAAGVWTGREAIIAGGSDTRPCPPNAGCLPARRPPRRDGAAFDPATGRWRRIARAPVAFSFAATATAGRTAYFLAPGDASRPGAPRALLAYRADRDRWRRLAPPRHRDTLLAAGGRLVAFAHDARAQVRAGGRWRPLPPDPLGDVRVRSYVWSGRELVQIACTSATPDDGPCLVRAAAFDFAAGSWRRLADAAIHDTNLWAAASGVVVNPALGTSDGGATNGWGRAYPNGGILDPATGAWSALPDPPSANHWEAAGVLWADGAAYFARSGYVLDVPSATWLEVPRRAADVHGETVVSAGRDLLVFGGARFARRHPGGRLLNTARRWSPDPPARMACGRARVSPTRIQFGKGTTCQHDASAQPDPRTRHGLLAPRAAHAGIAVGNPPGRGPRRSSRRGTRTRGRRRASSATAAGSRSRCSTRTWRSDGRSALRVDRHVRGAERR